MEQRLPRRATYHIGDDARQQKVLLVFMRALLQECQNESTEYLIKPLSDTYHDIAFVAARGDRHLVIDYRTSVDSSGQWAVRRGRTAG